MMLSDKRKYLFYLFASIFLLTIIFICCCIGRYNVSVLNTLKSLSNYFFKSDFYIDYKEYTSVVFLRLPRVIQAVLIGGALGISGAVYQNVFNNRLVSPDLLGVSKGCCVGASLVILIGGGITLLIINSFLFGLLAVYLTSLIAKLMRNKSNIALVLSGIVVSAIFSSIIGLIKYTVDSLEKLEEITFWIMGTLSSATMKTVSITFSIIILITAFLFMIAYRLNVVSLGETESRSLGLNYKVNRNIIICCSTLLTACATSFFGTISWIGLILPNMARIFVGSDNRKLLPMTFFLGALALPLIDTMCRSLTVNEIPISILTGLFGSFFFGLILIFKGRSLHD